MSNLNQKDMQNIEMQMYNRSRDIDVAIYNGMFSDLPKEYVLDSLLMYQNQDGGFGSGLYIDNYNPSSTVYVTYEALRTLYVCGFDKFSNEELYNGLINKAMNYLYNRSSIIKNKWNHNIESNSKFAHSDFFTNKKENLEMCGYYPTISIYALTLWLCNEKKAYYKKAYNGLKIALNEVLANSNPSKYEIMACGLVVEICNKLNLFTEEVSKLNEKMVNLVKTVISSKETWPNLEMPVILTDGLVLDEELNTKVEENLDYLIANRATFGLWEAFHKWGTVYPEEDSAKLKWIGYISWNYLYLLNKHKKIA